MVAVEETGEVEASIAVATAEVAVSASMTATMTATMTAEVSVPVEEDSETTVVALAIAIVTIVTDANVVENEIAIVIGIAGPLNEKDAVDGVVKQSQKIPGTHKRFKI